MRAYINKTLLFLIAFVLIITSCKKHNGNNNSSLGTVTATIFGRVTDASGSGIFDATATVNGVSTKTDAMGVFMIKNVGVNKLHAFVKITKSGYFDGSRTFVPLAGKTSSVQIQLITKNLTTTFSAVSGSVVTVGTASITFPANSVKNANGTAYTGMVNVYATYLDPTDAMMNLKMPGDLIGNSNGVDSLLKSFGMMNVELEDIAGNKLNIADGKEATISMAVLSSLSSQAPASIPLWYFDSNVGIWKREGTAILFGNKYIGNVKHFSWWNCDTPLNATYISFRLVDSNGNPVAYATTILTNIDNNAAATGITGNDGWVSGMVYADAVLKLEVYVSNACTTSKIFIKNIGPFSNNGTNNPTNLGDIQMPEIIPLPEIKSATYSGKVSDCNGNAVSNGYAVYYFNGYTYAVATDNNGSYSFNLWYCINIPVGNLIVTGYDLTSHKKSSSQTITVAEGKHTLANLSACDEVGYQYLDYQITGKSPVHFQLTDIDANLNLNPLHGFICVADSNNIYQFHASIRTEITTGSDSYESFSFNFVKNNNSGIYPITYLADDYHWTVSSLNDYYAWNANNPTGINTTVTKFAANVGDYFEGSFSGSFNRVNQPLYGVIDTAVATVTCSYRIKRLR